MSVLERLYGKWALVTGASSGIGLEFSRELAAVGCNLITVSNQPEALAQWAERLKYGFSVHVINIALDLTADDAVEIILSRLKSDDIVPALLVNNAGIFDFKAVENISLSRLDLYINLHIRVVTHLTISVGKMMAESGQGGYILNMSSMSCWMPMPGIAMYSATKAYIRTFSRAYRIEMKQKGVSVTVACPGGIATDLFGLSSELQKLGVRLGVLVTPQKFVHKALNRTLRRKAQYVNGIINRISIVAVALLPEWARLVIKKHLLDKQVAKA